MKKAYKISENITEFIAIRAFSENPDSNVTSFILHVDEIFAGEIRNLETIINIVNQKVNGSTFIKIQDDFQGVFTSEENINDTHQYHSFIEFENGHPDFPMDLMFQPPNEDLHEFILKADSVGVTFKAQGMDTAEEYYTERIPYHVFYEVFTNPLNE